MDQELILAAELEEVERVKKHVARLRQQIKNLDSESNDDDLFEKKAVNE